VGFRIRLSVSEGVIINTVINLEFGRFEDKRSEFTEDETNGVDWGVGESVARTVFFLEETELFFEEVEDGREEREELVDIDRVGLEFCKLERVTDKPVFS
jgi:hypothetical protein